MLLHMIELLCDKADVPMSPFRLSSRNYASSPYRKV
jgi:hypothetical protein